MLNDFGRSERSEARMGRRDDARALREQIEHGCSALDADAGMQEQKRPPAPALDGLHANAANGDRMRRLGHHGHEQNPERGLAPCHAGKFQFHVIDPPEFVSTRRPAKEEPVTMTSNDPLARSSEIETRPGLTYATHDGTALLGDLYLPKGAGPFPALVAVHGGGWQQGVRSAFQYWGPYLAARGYALFAISYRLAKKGQKTFPQAVQDVLAAVQFVRGSAKEFRIDPDRVALMGASAGAHLASLAALGGRSAPFANGYPQDAHAKVPTGVKVLVGVYGVYDLTAMWQTYRQQSPHDNNIANFLGAAPIEDRRLYFDASSIELCDGRQQPDRRVPECRDRGRPGRPQRPHRRLPAGAQAGGLLRAHLHRAGRAALLDERSDRRARKLFGFPRAPADALPGRAAVRP